MEQQEEEEKYYYYDEETGEWYQWDENDQCYYLYKEENSVEKNEDSAINTELSAGQGDLDSTSKLERIEDSSPNSDNKEIENTFCNSVFPSGIERNDRNDLEKKSDGYESVVRNNAESFESFEKKIEEIESGSSLRKFTRRLSFANNGGLEGCLKLATRELTRRSTMVDFNDIKVAQQKDRVRSILEHASKDSVELDKVPALEQTTINTKRNSRIRFQTQNFDNPEYRATVEALLSNKIQNCV